MKNFLHLRSILIAITIFMHVACCAHIQELADIMSAQAHCPTVLTAADFGTTGKTISESGYYTLCDDISYDGNTSTNAITVNADNVVIDLNGKSITQANANVITAISITADKHDIIIKNGSLNRFRAYSVEINNGCYNVTIDGMHINGSGVSTSEATRIVGSSGNYAHDIIFSNCVITGFVGTSCGAFIYAKNMLFENVSWNSNPASSLLSFQYINNSRFVNCHFDSNELDGSNPPIVHMQDADSILFDTCTMSSNVMRYGLFSETVTGSVIRNCNFSNNAATSTGGLFVISLESSGSGNRIESCRIMNNSSASSLFYGIRLVTESGTTVEKCICQGNSGSIGCYGIFDNGTGDSIVQCQSSFNTASVAYGIYSATGSNLVIQDCTTMGNTTNGIYNDVDSAIITGCIAGNNNVDFAGNYPPLTTGSKGNVIYGDMAGANAVDYKDGIVYLTENAIIESGYTISNPGYYILTEDVNITPTASINVITLDADDVVLDLNDKMIRQTNTQINVSGIRLSNGRHNIVVKNGAIEGLSEYGIHLAGNCYNIIIDNINVSGNGKTSEAGIYLLASSGNEMHDSVISNCSVTDFTGTAGGVYIAYAKNVTMDNVSVTNSTFSGTSTTAYAVAYASECLLKNCSVINNTFNNSSSSTALNVGICNAIHLQDCAIVNNSSNVSHTNVKFNSADKCSIENSFIANNSSDAAITGININSSDFASVKSCSLNYNVAAATSAEGIGTYDSEGTNIRDTNINNTILNGTGSAYGVYVHPTNGSTMIYNCRIDNSSATTASSGYGMYISDNPIVIQKCSLFGNSGTGLYNDSATAIITECKIGNNGTNVGGSYPPLMTESKENIIYGDSAGSDAVDYMDGVIYLTENAIIDAGYTISSPGYYILTEDVEITPTGGLDAIQIDADNVTLDLNGKMIRQTNTQATVNGISITNAKHDIIIKNGILAEFSRFSLEVTDNCYNVMIDNIHCVGGGVSSVTGIQVLGSSGNEVYNCTVKNCTITDINTTSFGINLNYCINGIVENCDVSKNIFNAAWGTAIRMDHGSSYKVSGCRITNNSHPATFSTACTGINSDSTIIIESTLIANNNSTDSFTGILSTGANCVIRDCQIMNNSASTTTCVGISLQGSNSSVSSCVINDNSAVTGANGIYTICAGFTITDTTCSNNNGSTIGRGFNIGNDSSATGTLVGCFAHHNTGPTTGDGFNIQSASSAVAVQDCWAFNNEDYGIYNDSATCIITGCEVGNNATGNFAGAYPPLTTTPKGNVIYGDSAGTDSLDYKDNKIYIYANTIGTTGYTIGASGYYVLAEDVPFTPGAAAQTALNINADYVTLDMNGKTIYHNDNSAYTSGIRVGSGYHDIVIKNGTLSQFYNNSTTVPSYYLLVNASCSSIDIDSVNITGRNGNDSTPMHFNGGSGTEILNSSVRNCTISSCNVSGIGSTLSILYFSYTKALEMTDCFMDSNSTTSTTLGFYACHFLNSEACLVRDSTFSNNTIPSGNSVDSNILVLSGCGGMIIDNCVLTGNTDEGGRYNVIGNISSSAGNTIKNCLISNNNTTGSGTVIRGIYDEDTTATLIENCTIIGSSAVTNIQGINDAGSSSGSVFRNCLIQGLDSGNVTYGIYSSDSDNLLIEDCVIHGLTGTSLVYGIRLLSTCANSTVRNCICASVVHATPANGIGFHNDSGTSSFYANRAIRNSTNYSGNTGANTPTAHTISRFGVVSTPPYYDSENLDIT